MKKSTARKFKLGSNDSGDLIFDLDLALKGRLLIQGSSGSGKSETVKKICYVTKDDIQSIIIDPESEYSQLRSEMPFLLVGPGGEVPATLDTAELVAHRLLETGVSAILALLELGHQRREWVRRFLVALDTAPVALRRETLLFVDEAHIFAMESGNNLDGVGMAVADIASRGRKRGIGIIVVTQRLALLSNHIIGLCENLLIGRTGLIDAPRTAKLFAKSGTEGRNFIKEIGRVSDGQFYAYGRAFSLLEPTLYQIERVPGTTLAKASKHGQRQAPPTPEQIRSLLPRFEDFPKEAQQKADTEDQLRMDLSLARSRIAELEKPGKAGIPKIPNEEIRKMREKLEVLAQGVKEAQAHAKAEAASRSRAVDLLAKVRELLSQVETALQSGEAPEDRSDTLAETFRVAKSILQPPAESSVPAKPVVRREVIEPANGSDDLKFGEQKILDAIAYMEAVGIADPEQSVIAMLAGYTAASSSFRNPRGALNTKGLITVGSGKISLTLEGRGRANTMEIERTNEAIQNAVLERLKAGERRLLKNLVDVWPAAMTGQELADASNYALTSSSFRNPRGALKSMGFITISGNEIRARDLLFPQST